MSDSSYPTSARPQAGFVSGSVDPAASPPSGAERVAAASGIPLLGGGTSAAGPEEPAPSASAFSILAPDEYELLRRVEKLEALVREQETVIAMCVQVATRAAENAGNGNGNGRAA